MKTKTIVAFCLAALVAGTSAQATDLTSYPGVEGRYMVNLGRSGGQTTIEWTGFPTGLVDYASQVHGGTWTMNDGDLGTYWDTYGGSNPEFAGYRFKLQAKIVTGLRFVNQTFWDGGAFAATPEVQYLADPHGAWISVPAENVTWDFAYNTSYDGSSRQYNLTFVTPLTNVWGIRLYGESALSPVVDPPVGDPGGFVGFNDLTVYGELDLGTVNLKRNLALGAIPYMSHFSSWSGPPEKLTDGDLTSAVDSHGGRGEDALGVLWEEPQYKVAAIGVMLNQYSDGGVFADSCIHPFRVEYTADGTTWTEVAGLNKGRYTDEWTNIARWWFNPQVAWLFTFDELNGIKGLRIIGNSSPRGSDTDGFVGAFEVEVFGSPFVAQVCDFDIDGDVDGADLALFMKTAEDVLCTTGPAIPVTEACKARDLDKDGDVDQKDFGMFQACYSGSGIPYNPYCGE